jgi:hypothetical protein
MLDSLLSEEAAWWGLVVVEGLLELHGEEKSVRNSTVQILVHPVTICLAWITFK